MIDTPSTTLGWAKRMRNARETLQGIVTMRTVRCDTCGSCYAIEHPSGGSDDKLADRQGRWLEERFASDHIQENKHPASIPLPVLPASTNLANPAL